MTLAFEPAPSSDNLHHISSPTTAAFLVGMLEEAWKVLGRGYSRLCASRECGRCELSSDQIPQRLAELNPAFRNDAALREMTISRLEACVGNAREEIAHELEQATDFLLRCDLVNLVASRHADVTIEALETAANDMVPEVRLAAGRRLVAMNRHESGIPAIASVLLEPIVPDEVKSSILDELAPHGSSLEHAESVLDAAYHANRAGVRRRIGTMLKRLR